MDDKWFCRIGDREFGPLLIAQLQRLSARGQLTAASPVRREDMDTWTTAANIPALRSYFAGPEPSVGLPTAKSLAPLNSRAATKTTGASPPPPASVASQTGIPIVAEQKAAAATVADEVERAGMSQGMITALIGLGSVAAVLLVVLIVVVSRSGGDGEKGTSDQRVTGSDAAESQRNSVATADTESAARLSPVKKAAGPPLVDRWSKARSTKIVKSALDGTHVCRVRINSIWVSDDPTGKVENPRNKVAKTTSDRSDDEQLTDADVLDITALGVTRKKRVDSTGKIIDPGPQPAMTPDAEAVRSPEPSEDMERFRYLFIELSLTNTSADRTLSYHGWNGDGEATALKDASLYAQDNERCLYVSLVEAPMPERHGEAVVAAGETIVDVLVFELPAGGFESLRLVLPQAAFGLTGNLGFTIRKTDVVGSSSSGPSAPKSADRVRSAPPPNDRPPSIDAIEQGIRNLRNDSE